MKVDELNETVFRTRRCGGCRMSGTFVGAESDDGEADEKRILFVGLNPGVEEAERGRPFVGPSGRLLRKSMAEAGIASWAIVNSLLCHTRNQSGIPQGSDCRANLLRYWRAFRPSVLVPCGNGAAAVFGVPDGITAASGRTYLFVPESGRSTVIMPIFHPSAILRNGGEGTARHREFTERLARVAGIAAALDPGRDDLGLSEGFVKNSRILRKSREK